MRMRFEEGEEKAFRQTSDRLMSAFDEWWAAQGYKPSDAADDFSLILDWKFNYKDGELDTWSFADVEEFLLSWVPRKLSAPATFIPPLVRGIAEGFLFLGEQGLLVPSSSSGEALAKHALSLAAECERRMDDPSNFGMAKGLFAGMGVDFDEEMTQDDLNALMDRFNNLPFEQRKAITDPHMSSSTPPPTVIGPVVIPTEARVSASAAAAPVLAGFRVLNGYFEAPGKTLTKTGNIKLADAQALSEVLGTESTEEQIGDMTFRRQSAGRMPDLDLWLWWAKKVGVLRTVRAKLIGVKAWPARTTKDPLNEALKAFKLLADYGPINSFRTWMHVDPDVDDMALTLLFSRLPRGTSFDFDELVDDMMRLRGGTTVSFPGHDDLEWQRRSVSHDLDLFLRLMERAGVIEQEDATYEDDGYFKTRTGGTISLTDFGIYALAEQARAMGLVVDTIDATDLRVEKLVALADEQVVSVGQWWSLAESWLESQPSLRMGLISVLGPMNSLSLLSVIEQVPSDMEQALPAALTHIVEQQGLECAGGLVAYGWLERRGLVDTEALDPDVRLRIAYGVVGLGVDDDPEGMVADWVQSRPSEDLLMDIAAIGRLLPYNAVEVLEALGRYCPDKATAKSARREALKVRSRLANAGR
ncbi:MAG: hypothetical protein V9E82_16270 [Candidatus Nanopelagicales bacterium]